MNIIPKFIESLSPDVVEEANKIHSGYINGYINTNKDNEEFFDAHTELHELLIQHIIDFVLNEDLREVDEAYNDDHIEVRIVPALNNTFIPSVRTRHLDAPASSIDPTIGVLYEQAMVWGFTDAILTHVLEQGIEG